MTAAQRDHIEQLFWPKGNSRSVWAILDGARDRRIFTMLLNSYITYTCLYSGALAPELEIAAPYLVQLEYEDRYSRDLLDKAWGNSWGVFLRSDTGMQKLRRHLRGLLRVQDARGRKLVFRYYDPRVLRVYLPTCTRDELTTVYGPIDCFWTESDDPGSVLQFAFDRQKLSAQTIVLASAQVTAT
jgi:hypothetical protein